MAFLQTRHYSRPILFPSEIFLSSGPTDPECYNQSNLWWGCPAGINRRLRPGRVLCVQSTVVHAWRAIYERKQARDYISSAHKTSDKHTTELQSLMRY